MNAHTSHHHRQQQASRYLTVALVLTLGFAAIEAVAGWWSGSLALLGDAGHMVTDAFALGLAAVALWIARRSPSQRHSYGMGRAEVVAALVNGLFMLIVVIGIVVEAIERLRAPQPVIGGAVMIVATIGMAINIIVALLLSRGEQTLNIRGALLHVIGDLLGSMAALVSGAVIYFTRWTPMILLASVRLMRDALHVIMEGVPAHLDLHDVGQTMVSDDARVQSVHDLHIWSLSSGVVALSAHVVIDEMSHWDDILRGLRQLLHERFGIDHVTLQPETTTHVLQHWPSGTGPSS
jgi:cobalt-zinc-cadmium efflux system protein